MHDGKPDTGDHATDYLDGYEAGSNSFNSGVDPNSPVVTPDNASASWHKGFEDSIKNK
ncbi:MAG: hypothetical protein OXH63_24375 [Gemmatimonadetes bacterium]|nr:hypothetical protein [Gemmatimonadota bacterium]